MSTQKLLVRAFIWFAGINLSILILVCLWVARTGLPQAAQILAWIAIGILALTLVCSLIFVGLVLHRYYMRTKLEAAAVLREKQEKQEKAKKQKIVVDADTRRPLPAPAQRRNPETPLPDTQLPAVRPRSEPIVRQQGTMVPGRQQTALSPVWGSPDDDEEDDGPVTPPEQMAVWTPPQEEDPEPLVLQEDVEELVDDCGISPRYTFRDVLPTLRSIIAVGDMMYGMSEHGFIRGTMAGAKAVGLIGLPGSGKSTLFYFMVAQLMMLRASFDVFDPHATLHPLKGMSNYAHKVETIWKRVPVVTKIFEDRLRRFDENGSVCKDPIYVLVVDELGAIVSRENMSGIQKEDARSVRKLLNLLVAEARKLNMFVLVGSQTLPATTLPTETRDILTSRYIFDSNPRQAQMAGLIDEGLPLLKRLKKAMPGTVILDVPKKSVKLVAIPYTTPKDIEELALVMGYTHPSRMDSLPLSQPKQPSVIAPPHRSTMPAQRLSPAIMGAPSEIDFPGVGKIPVWVVDHIKRESKRVNTRREVIALMPTGWKSHDKTYPIIQAVCDAYGLLIEHVGPQGKLVLDGDSDVLDPNEQTQFFDEDEIPFATGERDSMAM